MVGLVRVREGGGYRLGFVEAERRRGFETPGDRLLFVLRVL